MSSQGPFDGGQIGQVWCHATTALSGGSDGWQQDDTVYIGSLNTMSASRMPLPQGQYVHRNSASSKIKLKKKKDICCNSDET